MNTNLFRSLLAGAVCCAAALLLDTTAPRAWGAYNATFVSATPQTPISLGQPLDITVLVRNNTGDTWVAGDMGASWLIEMDQPSWLPGADPIYFSTTTSIPDGVTASMVARLTAAELPAAPGTYTVRLYTAYNLYDYTWQYMEVGNPKIVTFSIKTNHPPVITPVGTKAGVPTNLLTFKVTATDTDQPAQTLTFNLEPGAPAGDEIILAVEGELGLWRCARIHRLADHAVRGDRRGKTAVGRLFADEPLPNHQEGSAVAGHVGQGLGPRAGCHGDRRLVQHLAVRADARGGNFAMLALEILPDHQEHTAAEGDARPFLHTRTGSGDRRRVRIENLAVGGDPRREDPRPSALARPALPPDGQIALSTKRNSGGRPNFALHVAGGQHDLLAHG